EDEEEGICGNEEYRELLHTFIGDGWRRVKRAWGDDEAAISCKNNHTRNSMFRLPKLWLPNRNC
ncbi:hypothetical protein U1Q18_041193, partial [Sarracenia purpurea var. burkii]